MKKILLILAFALFLPVIAFADISIEGIVTGAVNTTLFVASAIVVILWVITGLLFLTAQGDPAKLGKAKLALFSAIGGTLLVIIASSAMSLVSQAFNLS